MDNVMNKKFLKRNAYCVKSVFIRSYSGLHFLAFILNSDQNNSKYGHFLRNAYHDIFFFDFINFVYVD